MDGSHPIILARRIVTLLESTKVNLSTEALAQADVVRALADGDIEHVEEVRLNHQDRIDVLCGSVGLEIKVKHPRRAIYRQIKRYADSDRIDALVLVTGTAWPGGQKAINGKPFMVANLNKGWL